jgi:hypothetical protein
MPHLHDGLGLVERLEAVGGEMDSTSKFLDRVDPTRGGLRALGRASADWVADRLTYGEAEEALINAADRYVRKEIADRFEELGGTEDDMRTGYEFALEAFMQRYEELYRASRGDGGRA